jgi:hypothetical protein
MLADIFQPFVQESPISVMVRGLLERMMNPKQLDEWFEQVADQQYTRDLLFSTVFELMTQVVCGVRKSVNRAYEAMSADIPVSITSVYNKLNGIEIGTSAELVRYSAVQARWLIEEMHAQRPSLVSGYRVRMLDGNCLAASEHRLEALREESSAPLPGKSLVVYDPALGLITDEFPCEDGHAQERALLGEVLARVSSNEVWVADRNFCTRDFLSGLQQRGAFFIIREHEGLRWRPLEAMCPHGRIETGEVAEQRIELIDEYGQAQHWRRIRIMLDTPTRDNDDRLYILTNLPQQVIDARQVAEVYRQRWTIETAFQHLEQNLNSEINTLGYPRAALFGFCVALVAYNVLAVALAALRQVHGDKTVDESVSSYALAEELSTTYRGMMIAIPAAEWVCFQHFTLTQMAWLLQELAGHIRLSAFQKKPRGPKKKSKKKAYDSKRPHVSTAKKLKAAAANKRAP